MATIKPLEDRIVVKAVEAQQTTASGLVIPDTAQEKPQEGEVIAVGPGRFNEDGDERVPMDIKVGDKVKKGQTLVIVEAMKTMNPIQSPRDGVVAEILVGDAQPVEFGEALVLLEA